MTTVRTISLAGAAWIAIVLAVCGATATLVGTTRAAPPPSSIPREVLTFYYGWYGTPAGSGRWRHWERVDAAARRIGNTADYPSGGVYDSHDPLVVDRQLRQMRQAGMTGLIVSWWGRKSFEDASLDLVAAEAPKFGLNVTAYYETLPNDGAGLGKAARVSLAVADVGYLLDRHGHDASWLHVAGRPVPFIYARAVGQLGADGWRLVADQLRRRPDAPLLIGDVSGGASAAEIRGAFAGVHTYNDSGATGGMDADAIAPWANRTFAARMREFGGLIRCLTLFPGFDNRRAVNNSDPGGVTPRSGGRTLADLGDAALAARPDWLLITSWNEWHEGSEIEPSLEYGDRPLADVARLARRFRALPARDLSLDPAEASTRASGGGS